MTSDKTSAPSSRAVELCGTKVSDPPSRQLCSDRLAVELENGQLRYMRFGGVEVLRGVAFLVRDENWGTHSPQIENLDIQDTARSFAVSYHAVSSDVRQRLAFVARVTGSSDGSLVFAAVATPETDFVTNRTGFVVLHPAGFALGGGRHLVQTRLSEPGRTAALAWQEGAGVVLWLANLTAVPLTLTIGVKGLGHARLQASILDAAAFDEAVASVDPLDALRRPVEDIELRLDGYAVARVEAENRQRSYSGDMREEKMAAQELKELAQTKSPKFGHFIVEFATPGIGHILKSAGCDFVLFDLEHSGFGFETVKSAIRYFEAADLPVIVRTPSKDYHHVARAMDMGAEGLMLPMVGNVEEARHILKSMKYAPDGDRGVALQVSHDRYRPGPVVDKFVAANRRSTFFCQIETAEGVDNADAIAALPGVDCLWVGHFDLSVSLGVPGEFGSKTFTDAIARVCDAARKHGKSLGRLVPTVQQGVDLYGQGFDFICYSGDVWVLHDALKDAVDKLREGCAAAGNAKRTGGER